jgi:uncharacterized protein
VVWRFGLPAVVSAAAGAAILVALADLPPLAVYQLAGRTHVVAPIKLVVAALILVFAYLELQPHLEERLRITPRALPLGGLLSGFFGGLSGHQGALRSAFLLRAGLGKEGFIATGIACAVLIDLSRLAVYGRGMLPEGRQAISGEALGLVLVATAAAFIGAVIGRRLLPKVTMGGIRMTVGILLLLVGVALGAGLI